MTKKVSLAGMITCVLYFLSMGLFLAAKTEISLTIGEMIPKPVLMIAGAIIAFVAAFIIKNLFSLIF